MKLGGTVKDPILGNVVDQVTDTRKRDSVKPVNGYSYGERSYIELANYQPFDRS